ncbi:MAG: C39 family peptidase [Anaerolineaceae bacterium]|nr:C39 family peptidase [Anaerolineaceae bacterium]
MLKIGAEKLFFIMMTTAAVLLSGCRKTGLPDPQVIHGPVITAAANGNMKEESTFTASPSPILTATPSPTAAPTAVPTRTPLVIEYDVPVLSQDELFLNGAPTGVGCVPVCIEMITACWNDLDSAYPVLPAQEIIDRNSAQGLYVAGRGMSSAAAADELAEIGYTHKMFLNSSKEELLDAFLEHGPVGVLVKTNWVPTTMNHAAVLTAYNEETDTVTLNDPFYGSEVSWTWDAFDGIWGLNYAGDRDYSGEVVRRVFFVIYPERGY